MIVTRRRPARPLTLATVAGLVAASAVAVLAPGAPAGAATVHTRHSVLAAAGSWGSQHGYTTGIAVYDTQTGYIMGRNSYSTFASESVVKTMIATRILLQGRMHGTTASRAYKMITQSDDAIASSFYGSVGGDGLITWIKKHYGIPFLGSPPRRSGWWGNTHITAAGLVTFYAKVKRDKKVGPWLINAMHHATSHGSDGFYQFFGLKQANPHAAIKQGWGFDYDDWSRSSDMNSTGFVGSGDRYAVAILVRGPARTYGTTMGNAITSMAKLLLPGGVVPDPLPTVTGLSATHGSTAGAQTLSLSGSGFTQVTGVWFGGAHASKVHVTSSGRLTAVTPAHAAGTVAVRVATLHGTSTVARSFVYGAPPAVTALSAHYGSTTGGASVTITGRNLGQASSVYFGAATARIVRRAASALTVTAPAHAAGATDVRVRTVYALSPVAGSAASYRYGVKVTATSLLPAEVPAAGGTVTITGSGFDPGTTVRVGSVWATITARTGTRLTVALPAQPAGPATVTVGNPLGAVQLPVTYTAPPTSSAPPTTAPTTTAPTTGAPTTGSTDSGTTGPSGQAAPGP